MTGLASGSRRRLWQALAAVLAGLAPASCAAPSLTLYTLGAPELTGAAAPLGQKATVIAVARVTLPDYLDTQDILVRRGNALESSHRGRWASRLSLGATELLTGRLAQSRPDALVTDQPQTTAPSYRLLINISRLDVAIEGGATNGRATLEADWLIVPRDPAVATLRDRTRVSVTGPIGTDQGVVAMETDVLNRLAGIIDVKGLR